MKPLFITGLTLLGVGGLAVILGMGWWGLLWCGLILAGDATCNIEETPDE